MLGPAIIASALPFQDGGLAVPVVKLDRGASVWVLEVSRRVTLIPGKKVGEHPKKQ